MAKWAQKSAETFAEKFGLISGIGIAVLIIIVLGAIFLSDPNALNDIARDYGLIGLFVASILANATILFPIPIDLFVFFLGGAPEIVGLSTSNIFAPLLIGIFGGVGASIGEMNSYLIGALGAKALEEKRKKESGTLNELRLRLEDKGALFVFLATMTPFPFDLIGIAAGMMKFDYKKFFLAALFGKTLRYIIICYAGMFGIGLIKAYFLHGA
ncbi:MAG: VTT domain-containing protein [Candidatus Diapherotrites archaeon]